MKKILAWLILAPAFVLVSPVLLVFFLFSIVGFTFDWALDHVQE